MPPLPASTIIDRMAEATPVVAMLSVSRTIAPGAPVVHGISHPTWKTMPTSHRDGNRIENSRWFSAETLQIE